MILHVIFEAKSQFFLEFCITLQCHERQLFRTSSAETLYNLDKRSPSNAKFQTFDFSREISPNLYFDRLLLLKEYKISAKQLLKSYVSSH